MILEIEKTLLELEKEKLVPEMEKIETERFQLASKMLGEISEYNHTFKDVVGKSIDAVGYERLPELDKMLKDIKALEDALKVRKDIANQSKEVSRQLYVAVEDAKSRGIKYVKCNNCGVYMEVGESVAGS